MQNTTHLTQPEITLTFWRFDLCQRLLSEEAGTQFFWVLTWREAAVYAKKVVRPIRDKLACIVTFGDMWIIVNVNLVKQLRPVVFRYVFNFLCIMFVHCLFELIHGLLTFLADMYSFLEILAPCVVSISYVCMYVCMYVCGFISRNPYSPSSQVLCVHRLD